MKKLEFDSLINSMDLIVRKNNLTPNKWTFLTSISYMLSSNVYMKSVFLDIITIKKHLKKGSKLLDIGTGVGYIAVLLSHAGYIAEGVDTTLNKSIPKKDFERFKTQPKEQKIIWKEFKKKFKTNFRHYDGKRLPYGKNSFDAVIAYAVIEHIADDEIKKVMAEIKRVLKSDGLLFIFKLPSKLSIAEYLGGILGIGKHARLFGKKQACNFFQNYGFEIKHFEREDMTFSFPPKLTNLFYPILDLLNRTLIKTPLRIFSHHMNLILINKKSKKIEYRK